MVVSTLEMQLPPRIFLRVLYGHLLANVSLSHLELRVLLQAGANE